MSEATRIYLEAGAKRIFACAVDWPGWCRSGKTEEEARRSLVDHGQRYAAVVKGIARFTPPTDVAQLEVIERIEGGSGTDFGVPSQQLPTDGDPVDAAELRRMLGILDASWAAFDAAAAAARGVELRKGPRGGGRDVPRMVTHVVEADEAYCHQLGRRRPERLPGEDRAKATERIREAIREAVTARSTGRPIADPNKVARPWSPRYAVRRSAWHALDHAWEIEDRSNPEPAGGAT